MAILAVLIGRFISPDTIIPYPANPQSFNRYSYCLNNPLKYVDPSGEVVEFVSGDIHIDTRWWYDDDPYMGVFLNDYIGDQETMDQIIQTAVTYEDFKKSDIEGARAYEEADEVYEARVYGRTQTGLDPVDKLNITNPDGTEDVYVYNPDLPRLEWDTGKQMEMGIWEKNPHLRQESVELIIPDPVNRFIGAVEFSVSFLLGAGCALTGQVEGVIGCTVLMIDAWNRMIPEYPINIGW